MFFKDYVKMNKEELNLYVKELQEETINLNRLGRWSESLFISDLVDRLIIRLAII